MNTKPLCVDLDHSLIRTDLIQEALLFVLSKRPFAFFSLLKMYFTSILDFKKFLESNYSFDPTHLPYNNELLKFIKQEKAAGRKILLITGSPFAWAKQVNQYLGVFDEIIGTTSEINMVGKNKVEYLNKYYGTKGYDYVGDSFKDQIIWKHSHQKILASSSNYVLNFKTFDLKIFDSYSKIASFIKIIRPHQWSKNLLLFVPLIAAHQFSITHLIDLSLAFISFSLAASSGYVINDMLDIHSDRAHQRKKLRPLSQGHLTLIEGVFFSILLLGISAYVALLLSTQVLILVLAYYAMSLLYSLKLKEIALIDTLLLAGLYTYRIITGAIVSNIELSSWLLLFAIFLFLGLANLKRVVELLALTEKNHRRSYQKDDVDLLSLFGICSGFSSILILSLYIYQDKTLTLYSHPEYLWMIVIVKLYWIMRLWLMAKKKLLHDDPITFALKDKITWLLVFFVFCTMYVAK